jgi:hypothetical protein
VLYRGNEPMPTVTDPRSAIRWMNFLEEKAKQQAPTGP